MPTLRPSVVRSKPRHQSHSRRVHADSRTAIRALHQVLHRGQTQTVATSALCFGWWIYLVSREARPALNRPEWRSFSIERKTRRAVLRAPLVKHYAQAFRLRRPTLYPLSYRRAMVPAREPSAEPEADAQRERETTRSDDVSPGRNDTRFGRAASVVSSGSERRRLCAAQTQGAPIGSEIGHGRCPRIDNRLDHDARDRLGGVVRLTASQVDEILVDGRAPKARRRCRRPARPPRVCRGATSMAWSGRRGARSSSPRRTRRATCSRSCSTRRSRARRSRSTTDRPWASSATKASRSARSARSTSSTSLTGARSSASSPTATATCRAASSMPSRSAASAMSPRSGTRG